mgnify:CR=1 FL=1
MRNKLNKLYLYSGYLSAFFMVLIALTIVAQILGNYGYEPNSVGEQTESAILGTKMLVSVYPSIPFLIAAGLLFFYVIDKDLEDRIESELSKRR